MNDLEKLAQGFMKIRAQYEELEKEANDLREDNERFRRRERAEEILINAQDKNCRLKTANVEDFMSQRATLENQDFAELDKIASAIDYLEEGSGFFVSDFSDENPNTDFTGWLNQISDGDLQ